MRSSVTVRSILENKGSDVYSLPPGASVYSALELMSEKGIGAILVIEDGRLLGILSERDYARKVILMRKVSRETRVEEIMSTPVTVVSPDCAVDEAMSVMTNKHIRHLPIESEGKVVGMISIGDLVKEIISVQAETIEHLHSYISGQYPG